MRFRLSVTFPEVPAGHACHEVVVEERNFRIAAKCGLMRILDNPHLKRRRIRSGMIRFARLDSNENARNTTNRNGGNQ